MRCRATTPPCVISASITSAATKTTGIIEGIRIDLGANKLRFDGGRVSRTGEPVAVFHRAAPARGPSSYNRHRQLSISVSGTFAIRWVRAFEAFAAWLST